VQAKAESRRRGKRVWSYGPFPDWSDRGEGLVEVRDQVVGILDPDADAHQVVGNAQR